MARKRVKLVTIEINGVSVDAKECTSCHVVKPLDMYSKSNDGSVGGRASRCKACKKAAQDGKKEELVEYRRKYYEENKSTIREKQRDYYESNREEILEKNAVWSEANKDKVTKYRRMYWHEHRERKYEIQRSYYERNIEKERERVRLKQLKRRAIERNLPAVFDVEWKRLLMDVYGGCIITGEKDDIHWDHFIPLATGKGGTHYGNMVPLKSSLNLSKNDRNPIDFFLDSGVSYEELYEIIYILAFLNDMSVVEYVRYVYECFGESA